MPPELLVFAGFQAAAFALTSLALVLLDRSQRPVLLSLVALAVPWFFGGPGFHCDHYQLLGPLADVSREPVVLNGWWLAVPWCYLWARWLVERTRPTRGEGSRIRVLAAWGVLAFVVGNVGPSGEMGDRPVVNLGWFMTVVVSYLGARGLVERYLPRVWWGAFAQLALAVAISAAIAVPVETFGTVAGLWAWRAHTAHESWVYGAIDAAACPPFEPFVGTGLLPFPADDALSGWCLKHVLPPAALLTFLEERARSVWVLLGRMLLAVSPLLVIVAQLGLARTLVARGYVPANPEGLASLEWLANTALVAVAVVLAVRLLFVRRGSVPRGERTARLVAALRDPLARAQIALACLVVVLLVVLAWRNDQEHAGTMLLLGFTVLSLGGATLARYVRDRRRPAAQPPPAVGNANPLIPPRALAACAGALACIAACLWLELWWVGASRYAWTVAPLTVLTLAVAQAVRSSARAARSPG